MVTAQYFAYKLLGLQDIRRVSKPPKPGTLNPKSYDPLASYPSKNTGTVKSEPQNIYQHIITLDIDLDFHINAISFTH